jgi:hypothetical protein
LVGSGRPVSISGWSCVSLAERWKVVRGKLPIGFSGDAVAKEKYAIVRYQADFLWCRRCKQGR